MMSGKSFPILAVSLCLLLLILLTVGCTQESTLPAATVTASRAISTDEPPAASSTPALDQIAGEMMAAVASRTPKPTPMPDFVDREITKFVTATGLEGISILGLSIADWLDLAVSALIILFGYLWGAKLIIALLKWIVQRLGRDFDDKLVQEIQVELTWLSTLFFANMAFNRLNFLGDSTRTVLGDMLFVLQMIMVCIISLKLINTFATRYIDNLDSQVDKQRLIPIFQSLQRLTDLMVLVVIGSLILSHFGFNVNALGAALIMLGVIVALGARSTISDTIQGLIILIDQPFRPGDEILIKTLETTGIVLEIGTRTCRIKTWDNVEVIIPNSQIGESQVVNYSYPDPSYRASTDLGVAYGSDMEQVRKVIRETLQGLEGVLLDKPIDVLFLAYGDSSRQVRVYWWIEDYSQISYAQDRANTALEIALDKAGIDLPNPTFDQNIKMDPALEEEFKESGSQGSKAD